MNTITRVTVVLLAAAATFARGPTQKEAPSTSIIGYVRDSGCVHRFHEVIKPLLNGCVEACVRGAQGRCATRLRYAPTLLRIVSIIADLF